MAKQVRGRVRIRGGEAILHEDFTWRVSGYEDESMASLILAMLGIITERAKLEHSPSLGDGLSYVYDRVIEEFPGEVIDRPVADFDSEVVY